MRIFTNYEVLHSNVFFSNVCIVRFLAVYLYLYSYLYDTKRVMRSMLICKYRAQTTGISNMWSLTSFFFITARGNFISGHNYYVIETYVLNIYFIFDTYPRIRCYRTIIVTNGQYIIHFCNLTKME